MPREGHLVGMTLPRVAIFVVLIAELLWVVLPRSGSHPLSPPVLKAAIAYAQNPTPATQAAFDLELQQEGGHAGIWFCAAIVLMLVVDAAGVYFFWNYGVRKATA